MDELDKQAGAMRGARRVRGPAAVRHHVAEAGDKIGEAIVARSLSVDEITEIVEAALTRELSDHFADQGELQRIRLRLRRVVASSLKRPIEARDAYTARLRGEMFELGMRMDKVFADRAFASAQGEMGAWADRLGKTFNDYRRDK